MNPHQIENRNNIGGNNPCCHHGHTSRHYERRKRRYSSLSTATCGGLLLIITMALSVAIPTSVVSLEASPPIPIQLPIHPSTITINQPRATRLSNNSNEWHHIYNPLNKTRIEINPTLSQRYEWIRQSPSLVKLLDYEGDDGDWLAPHVDAAAAATLHGHDSYINGGRRQSKEAPIMRLQDGDSSDINSNNNGHESHRKLDQYDDDAINDDDAMNYNADEAAYDDAAAADDDAAADDAVTDDDAAVANSGYICEDKTCTVNEQCTKFLFGFLEGTTDAKDNCEGIMNAYVAADCGTIKKTTSSSSGSSSSTIYNADDDFNDDYFGVFYDHQCCSSLKSHFYEYCDSAEILNGYNLLVVAAVMLLCECAKSIVKKNRIRWLPEAASCMLVGMAVALGATLFGSDIENIGFDEEIFMYLLLPPIIFEAALSVNKREFRRRRGAIMVFAVFGTLLSSFVTGAATYYASIYFGDKSLSVLDSLVFGSLISSIDPVAILSVLTSLKMCETDTIYILVFGESLLNDGIAITLFKSLVQQYDNASAVTMDDILGSIADFLIIAIGSILIGLACGIACLCYFHLNSSILHPVMEVASFFLWAVVPYWMSEALGWSGIVAIVIMGFFMDIYLRPGWDPAEIEMEEEQRQLMLAAVSGDGTANAHTGLSGVASDSKIGLDYYNWEDNDNDEDYRFPRFRGTAVDIPDVRNPPPALGNPDANGDEGLSPLGESSRTSKTINRQDTEGRNNNDADTVTGSITTTPNVKAILLKREFVRMSREADEHVRFVAHLLSSLSENAIFAYLGLFLFSSKYKWDAILCSIGITTCILSRAVMVVCASWFIWYMHIFRQRVGCNNRGVDPCLDECLDSDITGCAEDRDDVAAADHVDPLNTPISKSARALSNYKVQVVLILAGLRGAVSLALVENVPIYNGVTGIGSQNKPLLKAMTSSAIIFTIFVLGGGSYYILKWLDISSDDMLIKHAKRKKHEKQQGYNYPTHFCGGAGYGESSVELATAPSWRNHPHRSPRVSHMSLARPADLRRSISSDSSSFAPAAPKRLLDMNDGLMDAATPRMGVKLSPSAGDDSHASTTDGLNANDTQFNFNVISSVRQQPLLDTAFKKSTSMPSNSRKNSMVEVEEGSRSQYDADPPYPFTELV